MAVNRNYGRQEQRKQSEYRRTKKKAKNLVISIWLGILLAAVILLLIDVKLKLNKVSDELKEIKVSQEEEGYSMKANSDSGISQIVEVDTVRVYGAEDIDKPVNRDYPEILARLQELGETNAVIRKIYDDAQSYPEKMLEALANNPEMADFVAQYTGNEEIQNTGLTEMEKEQPYPLFLQWDSRWGYAAYGDNSNIGLSGCGPASLAMVLYYLTGDETITPDKIAAYSMENGYYLSGTGTKWALITDFPALYGIRVKQLGLDEQKMISELAKGNMIICAMREGDFTAGGHFIVIYGYDSMGFKVNDSNCVARSRKSWTFQEIKNQIKNIWSFAST